MPGGVGGDRPDQLAAPIPIVCAAYAAWAARTEARGYGLWRYRHRLPSDAVRAAGGGYDR